MKVVALNKPNLRKRTFAVKYYKNNYLAKEKQ